MSEKGLDDEATSPKDMVLLKFKTKLANQILEKYLGVQLMKSPELQWG